MGLVPPGKPVIPVVARTEEPSCLCLPVALCLLLLFYCLQCSVSIGPLSGLCMQDQDLDKMALFTPS